MANTSKFKIALTLLDQIMSLNVQNTKAATSVLNNGGTGRTWMLGKFGTSGWNGNPSELTQMKKAFDRAEVIDTLNSVMDGKTPGTTGDKIAMRFQGDYLAAMERAFRTRHAGAVRSEIFAAGRRNYIGSGNLTAFSLGRAQDLATGET
jgi:hypothetical protein